MDILSRFTDLGSSSPFLSEKTVHVWYVVVSSDQVFLGENLEIYHLALPLCIQVKEITRSMAEKRVEKITNKVMMINWSENDFIMGITIAELWM